MLDEALDLFLGSRCVGCDRPGRMLCPACRAGLSGRAAVAWPSPTPADWSPPWATESYDGAVRALVVGHKDRGQWGHRRVLGELLAVSVRAAVADLDPAVPVLLVPVPSQAGSGSPARLRGHHGARAGRRLARATYARRSGVAPLVVSRGAADQAGLDAQGRAANVHLSMCCPTPLLGRLARRHPTAYVVVCDDVMTTGATAREAQRALEAVGLAPVASRRRRRHAQAFDRQVTPLLARSR